MINIIKEKWRKFLNDVKHGFFIASHIKYLKDNFSLKRCWLYFKSNFSLRHVLCLQGLLKIAFLYSVTVLCLILNMKLPLLGSDKPYVAIYSTSNRIGEGELRKRAVIAAKNLGWNVIDGDFDESTSNYIVTSHFYYSALTLLNLIYKPKFTLAVTHYVFIVPSFGYNIVYLNVPNYMLFTRDSFLSKYKHLEKYDGYIDLYSVANGSNPKLTKALKNLGKEDAIVIPLYLSQNYRPYSPAKREEMVVIGSLWGCNRSSVRIADSLYDLAMEGKLVAYGIEDLEFLGNAYKGRIEDYDKGKSSVDNLFNLQKRYGIALAIHNLEHMIEKIPTSRVAESIASGSIVVSDQNGFIKQFFGDNILYFDALVTEDKIYSQLTNHIKWIRENPEEVEKKAKAAHEIFMNEFALEKQLQKLYDMLEKKDVF